MTRCGAAAVARLLLVDGAARVVENARGAGGV